MGEDNSILLSGECLDHMFINEGRETMKGCFVDVIKFRVLIGKRAISDETYSFMKDKMKKYSIRI